MPQVDLIKLFTCSRCGRKVNANATMYKQYYEGQELCVYCRADDEENRRLEKRAGAVLK